MLTDLARGLAGRGYAVHVVCSRQLYTDADAALPRRENRSGIAVHRVSTTQFGRGVLIGRAMDYASFYLSSGLTLLNLLQRGDVLVAKTDPPLIGTLAAIIARLKHAALVNWQQDVFPEVATHLDFNPFPRWLDSLLRRLRDWSLRRAMMNVVIGNRMQEYFLSRGIPSSQLRVIENWADDEAIAPKPVESSALRARLGLADRFVVCYSGNLGRAHEFDTLLQAAQMLQPEKSILFLMIGGGAKMEPLQNAVRDRALDNFRFLPYQSREDLADSLAAGDVHLVSLLPALEGLILPSKLYGILAAGRPLIFVGDADGEVARAIAEAGCGVTVPLNAGADLAASIRRLRSDPGTCLVMGSRARHFFVSRYSMKRALERWIAVLESH